VVSARDSLASNFEGDAVIGDRLIEIEAGISGLRSVRVGLMRLAYALSTRTKRRGFFVLTDSSVTVPRLREEWERLAAFRALIEQEREQPHRLADLAVDGDDLIEAGFREGPLLGRVLQTLLAEVVEEPERNSREQLLTRARELA